MNFFTRIVLILVTLLSATANASECYRYHTPQSYRLYVTNNQLVFQHTVKDPNQISYVSQETIIIPNFNIKDFKIVNEDAETFLFSTSDGYFLLEKDSNEIKNYGASRIATLNQVQESIGNHLFCIDGNWNYIRTTSYSDEIITTALKEAPLNLELIFESNREQMLFKSDKHVYLFSSDDFTFEIIPNLNPSSTQFVEIEGKYINILFDEDTIYTTDSHFYTTDHTALLSKFKAFNSFKGATINNHNGNVTIDTHDGYIWAYLSGSKTFEGIGTVKFAPVKATYLNTYKHFINVNGKIYLDLSNAIHNWKSLDVSKVVNLDTFRKDAVYYTDDVHYYEYDYDNKAFHMLKTPKVAAVYFPTITTYGFRGTRDMFVDSNMIYSLNNTQKYVPNRTHNSPLKNLELAYGYDDKLLIENQEIKNIGSATNLKFFGSIVDVISGCDGGRGQYPVEIDVYYFFKDKTHMYVCNTNNLKMRVVNAINNKDYTDANFKQLVVLMNLEKSN